MSQDDGEKKGDSKPAQEESKSTMTEQADNDGKEPENKPPLQHHFPWKWVFIGIAIIIGIGVIVLGITCFAALNSGFNS